MKTKNIIVVALLALILLAWAPWITKEYAVNRVIREFEESQRDIIDSCGFNCEGCGVLDASKYWFGYIVGIRYKCGFKMYFVKETKFVSFIGSIHSLNKTFWGKGIGKEISENEVREYLIKKYNPGTCYGMPPAAPPSIVANFTIALTKTDTGYDFILRDGRCCDVHVYEGKIRILGDLIIDEVTNEFTEEWAC